MEGWFRKPRENKAGHALARTGFDLLGTREERPKNTFSIKQFSSVGLFDPCSNIASELIALPE